MGLGRAGQPPQHAGQLLEGTWPLQVCSPVHSSLWGLTQSTAPNPNTSLENPEGGPHRPQVLRVSPLSCGGQA